MKQVTLPDNQLLLIRPAVPEDAEKMIAYFQQVHGESENMAYADGEFQMSVEEQREWIEQRSAHNRICLLGLIDGEIVACIHVTSDSRKKLAHIGYLSGSVRKEYWRKSVGTHMMQEMLLWAQSNGTTRKITGIIRVDHVRSIELCKQAGFQIEGKVTRRFYINGEFIDSYVVGIEIDPPSTNS